MHNNSLKQIVRAHVGGHATTPTEDQNQATVKLITPTEDKNQPPEEPIKVSKPIKLKQATKPVKFSPTKSKNYFWSLFPTFGRTPRLKDKQ